MNAPPRSPAFVAGIVLALLGIAWLAIGVPRTGVDDAPGGFGAAGSVATEQAFVEVDDSGVSTADRRDVTGPDPRRSSEPAAPHGDESSSPEPAPLRIAVLDRHGQPMDDVMVRAWLNANPTAGFSGITRDGNPLEWHGYADAFGTSSSGEALAIDARVVGQTLEQNATTGSATQIDTAPTPGELIEIRVDMDVGRLRVHLEDPHGRPLPGNWTRVRLYEEVVPDPVTDDRTLSIPALEHRSDGGSVTFGAVALDKRFLLAIGFTLFGTAKLDGPTTANRNGAAHVRLGLDRPLLIGRAVDLERRPQGGSRITVRGDGESIPFSNCETDEDGGFALALSETADAIPARVELVARADDGTTTRHEVVRSIDASGVTDLGDAVFGPAPCLVAGRVATDPLAACSGLGIFAEHRTRGSGDTWTTADTSPKRDGDAFWLFGTAVTGHEYRLRIHPKAHCHVPPAPIAFEPGTTDIDVTLQRGQTLQADIALSGTARWLTGGSLRLRPISGEAVHRFDPNIKPGFIPLSSREDRSSQDLHIVYWNGLLPGGYELAIHTDPFHSSNAPPFEVVGGIHVEAGDVATRVQVDLDSLFVRHGLRVVHDSDSAPEDVWLVLEDDSGETISQHFFVTREGDRHAFNWLANRTVYARAYLDGHAPSARTPVAAGTVLRLHSCEIQLGCRIVDLPGMEPGARLVFEPVHAMPQAWDWRGSEPLRERLGRKVVADALPQVSVVLQRPGPHRVALVNPTGEPVGVLEPNRIDPADGVDLVLRWRDGEPAATPGK